MIHNAHAISVETLLKKLATSRKGLSTRESNKRLKLHGANRLLRRSPLSGAVLLLRQFQDPLVLILVAAFAISGATGHRSDAVIIAFIIIISVIVSFIQEQKTSRAFALLNQMVKHTVRVLRDGIMRGIDSTQVVIGDVMMIAPGDKITVDARLIGAHDLEVDEAALTGESYPSHKTVSLLKEEVVVGDRSNMIFSGTTVARGTASAVVTAIGMATELGRVAKLVEEVHEEKTPLQNELSVLSARMSIILVSLAAILFAGGVLVFTMPLVETFLIAVAVLVAAVPEGLLPALTIILAVAMQKLSKRRALVRRLVAAETLGSVTVICTDKTGTLTQGEMRTIYFDGINTNVDFERDADTLHELSLLNPTIAHAFECALLNNNAVVHYPTRGKRPEVIADPTEKALVTAVLKAGWKKSALERQSPRIAEVPFDSTYKFMATLHRCASTSGLPQEQERVIYAKGAPEQILNRCSTVERDGQFQPLSEALRKEILSRITERFRDGYRVVAVAMSTTHRDTKRNSFRVQGIEDLTLLGWFSLADPLRKESSAMIQMCIAAGIRPIIVTGDHHLTAVAVARQLGLAVGEDQVMEGGALETMNMRELKSAVQSVVVFSRVEPQHKLKIVQALQVNGEVVAMTGDGVNDAPALKQADIGVAVGSGTDVAKETADLILLDNNFATIIEAIRQGRITFDNIRKVVLYLLTDSFSEMILIVLTIAAGLPLPIVPAQILWIKLIEDTSPAVALSFDEIDEGVMREPPRARDTPILDRSAKILIAVFALVMQGTLFTIFSYFYYRTGGDIDHARSVAFVGLGIASLAYVYSVRALRKSIFSLNPFSNRWLVATTVIGGILLLVGLYVPFFQKLLHTVPLGSLEWIILLGYALMSVVVYEVGKKMTIARSQHPSRVY